MSRCLLLFDSDGCTAVVPTVKVDVDARKGEKYQYMYCGKLHLVEVLEKSDSEDVLDTFERAWQSSARASVLSMRKELSGNVHGGYLACQPVDQTMMPVVQLRREDESVKKFQEGRKEKSNQTNKKEQSRKSSIGGENKSSLKVKKKAIQLKKMVTRCAKSITTKIKSLPTGKARKYTVQHQQACKEKNMVTATKPGRKRKQLQVEDGNKNRKKRMGTNGRTITVEYSGSMESSNEVCMPARQPMHVDHLTQDQRETVRTNVNLWDRNLTSTATQTEPVLIFSEDDDIKDFEKTKKLCEMLRIVKEVHKAVIVPQRETHVHSISGPVLTTDTVPAVKDNTSIKTSTAMPKSDNTVCPLDLRKSIKMPMILPTKSNESITSQNCMMPQQKPMDLSNSTKIPEIQSSSVFETGSPLSPETTYRTLAETGIRLSPDIQHSTYVQTGSQQNPETKHTSSTHLQPGRRLSPGTQHGALVHTGSNICPETQHSTPVQTGSPGTQQYTPAQTGSPSYYELESQQNIPLQTQRPFYSDIGARQNSPVQTISPLHFDLGTRQNTLTQTGNPLYSGYCGNSPAIQNSGMTLMFSSPEMPQITNVSQDVQFDFLSDQPQDEILHAIPVSIQSQATRGPLIEIPASNIIEIKNSQDMLGLAQNVKIKLARDTKHEMLIKYGHSLSSFSWKLTRTLFEEEDLKNKNFYGRGRPGLSPRRRTVIQDAVREFFHSDPDSPKIAVDAINSGIRSLRRKKLQQLTSLL